MTGVAGAARFGARKVARGQRGGIGRASGRIHNRHLLEGLRAHPAS